MGRILTVAMAVHEDLAGPWFTIEVIREFFPDLSKEIEFLIVDNSPYSPHGEAVRNYINNAFCREGDTWKGHYVAAAPRKSTSLRNLAFHCADTEFVLCVDSHVILRQNSLYKLIRFLKSGAAGNDLYQGPVYTESGSLYGTHMNPAFRGGNFGTWGVMQDVNGQHTFSEDLAQPFEIPAHGMGLFLARRDTWLQFPISFRHFSGEEGYTQEKYRLAGRAAWCLPFLGWKHFYGHVGGRTSYPNTGLDKLRNHLIGFRELGIPTDLPLEYFSAHILGDTQGDQRQALEQGIRDVVATVDTLFAGQTIPVNHKPFLGFPIRINDRSRRESEDYREFERILPAPK